MTSLLFPVDYRRDWYANEVGFHQQHNHLESDRIPVSSVTRMSLTTKHDDYVRDVLVDEQFLGELPAKREVVWLASSLTWMHAKKPRRKLQTLFFACPSSPLASFTRRKTQFFTLDDFSLSQRKRPRHKAREGTKTKSEKTKRFSCRF